MGEPAVARLAHGVYLVEHEGRHTLVYIAGPPGDRWAAWNGQVYHGDRPEPANGAARRHAEQSLTAPMPAVVVQVLVSPGARVRAGDALVVLEAMKMELPIRAPADATVAAVHCREGDLVQPETMLIELS